MLPFRFLRQAAASAFPDTLSHPPRNAGTPYRLALILTAAIVSLLLLNNRQFIFQAELHETGDWASNSLFVREAKQGWLLHGHYSRWDFYHPGPALFATLAVGEALFFNLLRIVPTPLNGQTIALCVATSWFFSSALCVFAQRLGKSGGGHTLFLPLALLFAIWHYGSVNGAGAFMETWPACPPILVFLGLLVACASVASGGGRELPLLVIAGGWLVHNYVAQPLFVVPLTVLAYAGLIVSCRHLPPAQLAGGRLEIRRLLSAGFRAFPRAHVAAGLLLVLFVLPLFLDALHGSNSNLSRILLHLHQYHEPLRKPSRSFCYFLIYGSYGFYNPAEPYFGKYTTVGMLAFVELHWRAYLCWITTLLAAPILFLTSHQTPSAIVEETGTAPSQRRSTFIRWFYTMLAVAFLLTLYWGMKQDGQMFYFNAFFNYSIYYGAALGLAAALAVFLRALTSAPGHAKAHAVICAVLWASVAAVAADRMAFFKIHDADTPEDRQAAQSVTEAAKTTVPPDSVCFVDCDPWDGWPQTVGVVLQLERLGYKPRVNGNWSTMFGARHTIDHDQTDLSRNIVRWRVVPIARDPARLNRWPLQGGYGIEVKTDTDINPADGQILFAANGNFSDYAVFGWPPTGGDYTWSDERTAVVDFHPLPQLGNADKDVELSISAWSYAAPGSTDTQRMEIQFDGQPPSTVRLPIYQGDIQPIRVRVDSAHWKEAVAHGRARLLFRFPDAKSPASVGSGSDTRPLGGAFHAINFRLVDKEVPVPGA